MRKCSFMRLAAFGLCWMLGNACGMYPDKASNGAQNRPNRAVASESPNVLTYSDVSAWVDVNKLDLKNRQFIVDNSYTAFQERLAELNRLDPESAKRFGTFSSRNTFGFFTFKILSSSKNA